MKFRVFTRLLQIHRVLVRHGVDEFVQGTRFAGPLRLAYLASPAAWFHIRHPGTRGERLRLALQELGPIFMKFGQALSTRRDLLPAISQTNSPDCRIAYLHFPQIRHAN